MPSDLNKSADPATASAHPPEADHERAARHRRQRKLLWIVLILLAALGALVWYYWEPICRYTAEGWEILWDRERFRARIESYGAWAPLAFISVQFIQVLFSPVPGELTGAAGGYIFGWWQGLLFSTVGLSVGSWVNFFLARLLGRRLVERLVPPNVLARVAYLMERQGVIASFIFFVIPGFPKDYFCFALGITPMSPRIFMIISSLGRVPGTLMLSLQGAMVYHEQYWSFALLTLVSVGFILPVWLLRERIYHLLYKLEGKRGPLNGHDQAAGEGHVPDRKAGEGLPEANRAQAEPETKGR